VVGLVLELILVHRSLEMVVQVVQVFLIQQREMEILLLSILHKETLVVQVLLIQH
jgi:hypothetical protein